MARGMKIIGIDPSTTKVGVYIFEDDGTRPCVWQERAIAIIPKVEKNPEFGCWPAFNGDDLHYWRIIEILAELKKIISAPEDALVVIENYSAGSYGNTDALAELGGAIRLLCMEARVPFITPSPNQLKKFILGKGNGEKAEVPQTIARRYGKWFDEIPAAARGDVADAYVLARIGLALYQASVVITSPESKAEWRLDPNIKVVDPRYAELINFIDGYTVPQKEVLIKICEKLTEIYCKVTEIRVKQAKRNKKNKE